MATSLLLAIFCLLAGALTAHRWLRESDPWAVAGLTPLLGACLGSLLTSLHAPPLELYLLVGLCALLLAVPGPRLQGWGRAGQALLALAGTALGTLMLLAQWGDAGWSGLEVADEIRFHTTSPGFEALVARFTPSFWDPLGSSWAVQLALQCGASLLLWAVLSKRRPGAAGLLAAWLVPLAPASLGPPLAALSLYLLLRLLEPRPGLGLALLSGAAFSLFALVRLAPSESWPWWLAGWTLAALRLRSLRAWLTFVVVWLAALPPTGAALAPRPDLALVLVPLLLLGRPSEEVIALAVAGAVGGLLGHDPWELRVAAGVALGQRAPLPLALALAGLALALRSPWELPVTPAHWRALHQQVSLSSQHALGWIAPQTLPGEKIVCDQAGPAALAPVLCALQARPKDAVWQAFRHTGRGDLLAAAGIHWVLADPGGLPASVHSSPWLTPGPTFHDTQPFQVRAAGGPFKADFPFATQVTMPRGPLAAGRWYPVHLEVTNHDREPRLLGWVRCQVQDAQGQDVGPPLELLPQRGRLGPGAGDVVEHSLVTPDQPGQYRLLITQPYTEKGTPYLLDTLPFEVK